MRNRRGSIEGEQRERRTSKNPRFKCATHNSMLGWATIYTHTSTFEIGVREKRWGCTWRCTLALRVSRGGLWFAQRPLETPQFSSNGFASAGARQEPRDQQALRQYRVVAKNTVRRSVNYIPGSLLLARSCRSRTPVTSPHPLPFKHKVTHPIDRLDYSFSLGWNTRLGVRGSPQPKPLVYYPAYQELTP